MRWSYPASVAGLPRSVGRLELLANIAGIVGGRCIVLELGDLSWRVGRRRRIMVWRSFGVGHHGAAVAFI